MKNSDVKILVVDDEPAICEVLSASLKDDGYFVVTASSGEEALKLQSEVLPHIVLLDVWMPGDLDGIQVLNTIKNKAHSPHIIMMSGHGTIETAVNAVKNGAFDFVEKPISMDRITILINNILAFEKEKQGKQNLLSQIQASLRLIGISEESKRIKQLVTKISASENPSLIQGEKGTGKITIAKNIHFLSSRASSPFIDFKCATVPKELLFGELFGYSKGSLPGLEKDKKGIFELAQRGTVYLDGATHLSEDIQQALLKLLKTGKASRAGSKEDYDVDVRLVMSSDTNLESAVKEGQFREDLFYRMNLIPLEIKPLRDRPEDLPILFDHFADEICRKNGLQKKIIRPEAFEVLKAYQWPGNVRELQNFLDRLYILLDQEVEIGIEDLSYAGLPMSGKAAAVYNSFGNFREARAQFEKEFLLAKIEENNGNISKTSEAIGLERSYLHRKIKAYGIEVN